MEGSGRGGHWLDFSILIHKSTPRYSCRSIVNTVAPLYSHRSFIRLSAKLEQSREHRRDFALMG